MKNYIPESYIANDEFLIDLCESSTGYLYNFIINTGTDTVYEPQYCEESGTAKIVLSLIHPVLENGYRLSLNNYYASIDLAEKLEKKSPDFIGRMRINRAGLLNKLKQPLAKGETIANVFMMSTIHMTTVFIRNREVKKPTCVLECNAKMGGVDLAPFLRKSKKQSTKYFLTIFCHLLSITTTNSYII